MGIWEVAIPITMTDQRSMANPQLKAPELNVQKVIPEFSFKYGCDALPYRTASDCRTWGHVSKSATAAERSRHAALSGLGGIWRDSPDRPRHWPASRRCHIGQLTWHVLRGGRAGPSTARRLGGKSVVT